MRLEFICSNCDDRITLEVSEEDHEYYLLHRHLNEGSEAYHDFFDGHGWVLQQAVFCDICKYEHSEVYMDSFWTED